jgi:hypothetical protein
MPDRTWRISTCKTLARAHGKYIHTYMHTYIHHNFTWHWWSVAADGKRGHSSLSWLLYWYCNHWWTRHTWTKGTFSCSFGQGPKILAIFNSEYFKLCTIKKK